MILNDAALQVIQKYASWCHSNLSGTNRNEDAGDLVFEKREELLALEECEQQRKAQSGCSRLVAEKKGITT